MQAITVLLLDLAQRTSRVDLSSVTAGVEKLAQWLKTMRPLDGVADRAYSIVCNMLSKDEQSSQNVRSNHSISETMLPSSNDPSATDLASQIVPNSNLQTYSEPAWPPASFNDDYYAQGSQGTSGLNPLFDFPTDSYANSFQFGQEPYPFFYENQFTTLFDQSANYDYDDFAEQVDWSKLQEQKDPQ